jgi:PIN domain nuclease of toxin-antitoxin system
MSSVNAPQSHELIVGPDGSIPADQIARLGLRPGTHLRVVAEPGLGADDPARTSLAGALRERIDDAALDRFDAALAANRRERIAARRAGVRVVADSHVLVWYLTRPERLTALAFAALSDAEASGDGIGVAAVTLIDLWHATRTTSRPVTPGEFRAVKQVLSDASAIEWLPLTVEVAERYEDVPHPVTAHLVLQP